MEHVFICILVLLAIKVITNISTNEKENKKEDIVQPEISPVKPVYISNPIFTYEAVKRHSSENKKNCAVCGSWVNVQVHHIVPIQYGGTDDKSNLIKLCLNCHEKEHNYKFDDEIDETEKRVPKRKYLIISKAISQKKNLRITYFSPAFNGKGGGTTNRVIRPINLHKAPYTTPYGKNGFHMTVKAYCFLRNAERNFQVRRIKEIEIL